MASSRDFVFVAFFILTSSLVFAQSKSYDFPQAQLFVNESGSYVVVDRDATVSIFWILPVNARYHSVFEVGETRLIENVGPWWVPHTWEDDIDISCLDVDEGFNTSMSSVLSLGGVSHEQMEFADECISESNLFEMVCHPVIGPIRVNVYCGEKGFCNDGTCQSALCTDTDGGFEPSLKGVLTYNELPSGRGIRLVDDCISIWELKEHRCTSDGLGISESFDCRTLGGFCRFGRCDKLLCEDSDGGINPEDLGTVRHQSRDSLAMLKVSDSCLDESILSEAYCDERLGAQMTNVNCGPRRKCIEGRCVTLYCQDSDGGLVPDVQGSVTFLDELTKRVVNLTDYCVSESQLKEYSCTSGSGYVLNYTDCGLNRYCVGGRCLSFGCVDSDGGLNMRVAGHVDYVERSTKTTETLTDYCLDDWTVKEHSCTDDLRPSYTKMTCGEGENCEGGMCISRGCTDSDGGEDYEVVGVVSFFDSAKVERVVLRDNCADSDLLSEAVCEGVGGRYNTVSCTDMGFSCVRGRCRPKELVS